MQLSPLSAETLREIGQEPVDSADISVEGICCVAIEMYFILNRGPHTDDTDFASIVAKANYNLAHHGFDTVVDEQYIGSLIVAPSVTL